MKQFLTCMGFSAGFALLVGCSNPADNVAEATVTDASENLGAAEGSEKSSATLGGVKLGFLPDSRIDWIGSKVTGKHEGGFKSFRGTWTLPGDDVAASLIEVEIDVHSMWSDNQRLTGHLLSSDFFDVENFPTSTFRTTEIKSNEEANGFSVSGDFTLHGVTKSISFPATIEKGENQVSFKAEFFIKRFDFGIVYKGRADDLIRDEVVIKLDLQASADALQQGASVPQDHRTAMASISDESGNAFMDQAIAEFDRNKDGKLDEEERSAAYQTAREHWGASGAEEQRKRAMARFDANGDGELDPGEREAMKASFRQRTLPPHILEKYDLDKDGHLNEEERGSMMASRRAVRPE